MLRLNCLLAVFLLGVLLPATPWAAPENGAALPAGEVITADERLRAIGQALEADVTDRAELREFLGELPSLRDLARRCIDQNQQRLESIRTDLDVLGEIGPQELEGVRERRDTLMGQQGQVERQLQLCRVLLLRANEKIDRITRLQQAHLIERLSQREAPAWEVIGNNLDDPAQWWSAARLFLLRDSGLAELTVIQIVGLVGLVFLSIGGSLYAREPMFRWAERLPGGPTMSAGFARALVTCAADVLPSLVTAVAVSIYLTVLREPGADWSFINLFTYALALYFAFVFLVRVFLAPTPPARTYLPAPAHLLASIARRLRTVAVLLLAIAVVPATLLVEDFPDPVQQLLRLVVATVLIVELGRTIWLVGDLLRWQDTHLPRIVLIFAMGAALVAEWAGYLNLSVYIVLGLIGTLVGFGLAWFAWHVFDELFDGLDEGRHSWHRRVRGALGLQPDQYVPGLFWLRLIAALLVWGLFGLLLLIIWGMADTGIAFLTRTLTEGFSLGEFELVPIDLIWGVVALIALIGVTAWFKQRLHRTWLPRTRMERGAREAVVTVSGYAGVAIAILVGLAVAGVQLTHIAIIAGALSVGIGFGLQNIFNNFVSGLILLFERPVKTDDWIVVGNTEGLVKRISIRTTQIKTFDHADVIVPNSEIIQGQVVNWMLRDPFGRVTIPVRVAFDSDPDHVRELLLEIGREHPYVITDPVLTPAPEVLFRRFGDYGLEFELRVFIRAIDYVLQVQSDLNLAINRRFREEGIVIPYPRTDVRYEPMPRPQPDVRPPLQSPQEGGDSEPDKER